MPCVTGHLVTLHAKVTRNQTSQPAHMYMVKPCCEHAAAAHRATSIRQTVEEAGAQMLVLHPVVSVEM